MASTFIEACAAKADRVSKVIPVDIPGIGRAYVRPRLVGERDEADAPSGKSKQELWCWGAARLICSEDGERLSQDERVELEQILMRLTENDLVTITNAADGNLEAAPGN